MKYVKHIAASAVLAASMSATSFAGTLVINSDASDPAPKRRGVRSLTASKKKTQILRLSTICTITSRIKQRFVIGWSLRRRTWFFGMRVTE